MHLELATQSAVGNNHVHCGGVGRLKLLTGLESRWDALRVTDKTASESESLIAWPQVLELGVLPV